MNGNSNWNYKHECYVDEIILEGSVELMWRRRQEERKVDGETTIPHTQLDAADVELNVVRP